MPSRVASWKSLASAAACGCVLLLGCGESRDLDALGVSRPDGGVWYLEAMQEGRADGDDTAGGAGSSGSGSTGSGARAGSGGSAAGTGGSSTGTGGRTGGTGTSGSGGAGTVPLPAAGTGGFQFPGAGGQGGFQFPGSGGQGAAPPPPSEDVSSCSPCESLTGTLGGVPACCTDDNQCGADLSALGGSAGCVEREQPGAQTDQCPQVSIMGGGFQIPGCCLPNGRCGIVIMRLAPLGCVEPGVVEDLLQFDAPSGRPASCTP